MWEGKASGVDNAPSAIQTVRLCWPRWEGLSWATAAAESLAQVPPPLSLKGP